jgi:hypothetical protein
VFRHIGDLAWIQTFIGLLEVVLAGCIVSWGWIFMLLLDVVLVSITWIGLNVSGCIEE